MIGGHSHGVIQNEHDHSKHGHLDHDHAMHDTHVQQSSEQAFRTLQDGIAKHEGHGHQHSTEDHHHTHDHKHREPLAHISDDFDLEKEINDMDALAEQVIDIKFRAEQLLDRNLPKPNETLNATLGLIDKLKEESAASRQRSLLPNIQLPRSDGSIEKYEEFMDSFEAIIRNNPNIEDVEKFIFLKSHLDSPASDLLEGFSTTNKEYPAALALLKETYGNKPLLSKICVSKLLSVDKHDGKNSMTTYHAMLARRPAPCSHRAIRALATANARSTA